MGAEILHPVGMVITAALVETNPDRNSTGIEDIGAMSTAVHPAIHDSCGVLITSGRVLTICAGVIIGNSFPRAALLDQIPILPVKSVMTEIIILTHVCSLVASSNGQSLGPLQWVEARDLCVPG